MAKKARPDAHSKSESATDAHKQVYDNVLKRLIEKQAASVIPLLLGSLVTEIVEELNIEVLIPPRRTDRAYKTRSKDGLEVLDLEFETSASSKIDKRLLIYHAILLEKYDLPVTSLLIYPFEEPAVASPLIETKGGEEVLRFYYQTFYLPNLDARLFVEQGAVPVYGLLPAMSHRSDELLLQAIEEMIEYYQENDECLRDELMCFAVLLRRARRLPQVQFERVLRRIRMFDQLLEEDPWVKEKVAEGEAKGRTNGASKELVRLVHGRYPALLDLAKARVTKGEPLDVLDALIEQLWAAPDEQAARTLLETYPAS
jgi:hypothetical protein